MAVRLQAPRLAALAERLETVRPLRSWGVPAMDWRAWQAAAQEAASLPSAEWSSWRNTVGTEATAWPPKCAAHPPTGDAHR